MILSIEFPIYQNFWYLPSMVSFCQRIRRLIIFTFITLIFIFDIIVTRKIPILTSFQQTSSLNPTIFLMSLIILYLIVWSSFFSLKRFLTSCLFNYYFLWLFFYFWFPLFLSTSKDTADALWFSIIPGCVCFIIFSLAPPTIFYWLRNIFN